MYLLRDISKKGTRRNLIVAGAIIFIFSLSVYSFDSDFRHLRKGGFFQDRRRGELKKPLSPSDVDAIRPWMTFDYINKVFGLPEGYLKNELGVAELSYPHLSVKKAARAGQESEEQYLNALKNTVRIYLFDRGIK